MAFFSKWFGDSRRPSQGMEKHFAPGTGIAYDEELIGRFKGHHQSLLKLFGTVSQAVKVRDYPRAMQALKKLLHALEHHVLEENVKLYVYLERCIVDGYHNDIVRDMKQEMGQIGTSVRSFIRHHLEFGINDENVASFLSEMDSIGVALTDRIQREEDGLYPLYLPPQNYA